MQALGDWPVKPPPNPLSALCGHKGRYPQQRGSTPSPGPKTSLLRELSKAGCSRVVLIDLPAFGRASTPPARTKLDQHRAGLRFVSVLAANSLRTPQFFPVLFRSTPLARQNLLLCPPACLHRGQSTQISPDGKKSLDLYPKHVQIQSCPSCGF